MTNITRTNISKANLNKLNIYSSWGYGKYFLRKVKYCLYKIEDDVNW